MSRNVEKNRIIRDERHEQILNSSLTVFAQKGLSAAKISDIAASAELSHGLVYHYFKSKEEIYIEVIKQTVEASKAARKLFLSIQGTPLEKIKKIAEANINYINEGDNAFRWLIIIQATMSETTRHEIRDILANSLDVLNDVKELIEQGQQTGEIVSGDPSYLATAFLSLLQGLVFYRIYWKNEVPMPDIDTIMRLLTGNKAPIDR